LKDARPSIPSVPSAPQTSIGPQLYRPPTGNRASTTASKAPNPDIYVPPRMRNKVPGSSYPDEPSIEETSRIHVTNLSDDVTEQELREKFSEFGAINKIYIVKDKETGESKGSAFITFYSREAAKAAMEKLNGTGWMSLIMNIEWARPSGPRM